MSIIVNKAVAGLDKELLLIGEGYIARPVTVDKTTISGLQPNEDGKYVIPYGTFLYGSGSSLLDDPQQVAKAVEPVVTQATTTIGNKLKITAKAEGDMAYVVTLTVGTDKSFTIIDGGTGSSKTFDITLPINKSGNVTVNYNDIIELINNDTIANTYIIASLASGADGTVVASAGSGTTSGGGAATVSSDIDGVLYHSVDVTNGEATGAMIIAGYINVDNMPSVPGAAVKAKIPRIVFARKD